MWAAIGNRAGATFKLLVVEGCRRELRLHCQTTSTFGSLVQGVSILKWQMIKPWHKSKGQQWFKESTIGQSQQSFKVVTSVTPPPSINLHLLKAHPSITASFLFAVYRAAVSPPSLPLCLSPSLRSVVTDESEGRRWRFMAAFRSFKGRLPPRTER